tara:strand:- start:15447 stop:18164 length:2718 start_codon:yes stop_codon:yes gene_type:complete
MRLSKIKLSGFKTFVEPTTLTLPSNLVGIVGPNGCGKSNVIDAVRWVLGESSAKYLRGESMSDVIFNGSSTRKPVSNASIELFFDNTQKKIGGEFAQYNEISTRRELSRDGQSEYFLNGTKCRRKDITNLFLGTGLGPRSYAIVQQAMISDLIEAKPDEMRVFIEEASGISKYKQKRKETESRIKNTRENLNRLNDLKDEIDKQLKRLRKQKNDAERYKKLKSREKEIGAELIYIKIIEINNHIENNKRDSSKYQDAYENQLTKLRKVEADIEELRVKNNKINEHFNIKQKDHFGLQADIARLEQSIEYEKELASQKTINAEEIKSELEKINREISKDDNELKTIEIDLEQISTSFNTNKVELKKLIGQLSEIDRTFEKTEKDNESIKYQFNEKNTIVEKETVKVNLLQKQLSNQEQQKSIINDLHELEKSFNHLKSNLLTLFSSIKNTESVSIDNEIGNFETQLVSLSSGLEDTENEILENEKDLKHSRNLLDESIEFLEKLNSDKILSDKLKNDLSNQKNRLNQKINNLSIKVQSQELKFESLKASQDAMKTAINRLEAQRTQLKSRSLEITLKNKKENQPEDDSKRKLESLLNKSLDKEKDLDKSRKELEDSQTTLRNTEIDRTNINSLVNQAREELEHFNLNQKEYEVRRESLDDQITSQGKDFESLDKKLKNKSIDQKVLDEELNKTLKAINRLGDINLAASKEYDHENERMQKLNSQFEDLNRALDTLNGAIKQIDEESKIRFNDTFSKVNKGLEKHFPRLFDGGKAYLELENNDALEGGVFVMARPPGKRNSNIHLLSGGEKALTAVALLFSIFELNPAPFCLLDEVDAPLDDTNVSRFCEIVKEMSNNVQFVVITHNKTTMELTKQLIGVTMSEPGVSRLVSVDVNEAVEMTEENST